MVTATVEDTDRTNTRLIARPKQPVQTDVVQQEHHFDAASGRKASRPAMSDVESSDDQSTLWMSRSGERGAENTEQLDLGAQTLDGAVLETEGESVNCEIFTKDGSKKIAFPRGLFPENVEYGMPIQLGIVVENGTRKMVIKQRSMPESAADGSSKRIQDLIDQL